MGYPGPQPTRSDRPKRSLKSVAIAVVMIIRTRYVALIPSFPHESLSDILVYGRDRNLARNWAKTSEVAVALREAHDRQRGGSPAGRR